MPDYIALAKSGIKFNIISNGQIDFAGDIAQISRLAAAVPGSIASIEGINEFNTNSHTLNGSNSQGNPAWAQLYAPQLWNSVKGSATLSNVPVIAASMANANADDLAKHGDVSKYVDSSNWHVYYGNGDQPSRNLASGIANARSTAPGKPVTVTETGYYTAVDAMDWGGGGVSEPVQAILTVNLLLDAYRLGASRTYLYELLDNTFNPSSTDLENTFGLFKGDGTPKAAATAIHNLNAILADTAGNAGSFAPGSLNATFSGLPGTASSLLMQKSDGTFDLAVWNEAKVWDQPSRSAVTPSGSAVTVDLGATYASVKVYNPLAGAAPIQTLTNSNKVQLTLTNQPYIIEVAPSQTTTTSAGPSVGTGADTLVISLSGDSYQGDAQFTATIDGKSLGAAQAVTAKHSAGQTQAFTFRGDFGAGAHTVAVAFLNDAYGGSASTDRNLYVDAIALNGRPVPDAAAALLSAGTRTFAVPAAPAAPATQDTLRLHLSQDAWQGNAQFTVAVDGVQVGATHTVAAARAAGATQALTLQGAFGKGPHTVAVTFLNDAYGGSASTDRNLYVDGADFNGVANPGARASLLSNGTARLAVTDAPPAGPDLLRVRVAEDAYQGHAQFRVAVDGRALGSPAMAFAAHAAGEAQDFLFAGDFGPGQHRVEVTFLNDAYGGSAATDRNLYLLDVSLDGKSYLANPTSLLSTGQTAEILVQA